MIKKITAILTIALMLAVLCVGCGEAPKDSATSSSSEQPTSSLAGPKEVDEASKTTVVATVNGVNVYKSTIDTEFNAFLFSNGVTEDQAEEGGADLKKFKEEALGAYIEYELTRQKAKEMGLELTQAERDTFKDKKDEAVNAATNDILTYINKQEEENSMAVDKQTAFNDMLARAMTQLGVNNGVMDIKLENQMLIEKIIKKLQPNLKMDDKELKAYYDAQYASQKMSFDENSALYEQAVQAGNLILYAPAGTRYVKHILIALPKDKLDKINSMEQEEGLKMYYDELKKIKPKADEAYAKATAAGADFDAVIAQYGEDEGMNAEPYKTNGYEISSATSAMYDKFFVEGVQALQKIGDISKPVSSTMGYHIIKFISGEESASPTYEQVKEELKEYALKDKRNKAFDEEMEKWKQSAKIEKFIDKL